MATIVPANNFFVRLFLIFSISFATSTIPLELSDAAELTSCGSPGSSIRLDPVRNPLEHATSGKQIGSEKLTGVVAEAIGTAGVSVRWNSWAAGSSSLTTYYIFLSANGGATGN